MSYSKHAYAFVGGKGREARVDSACIPNRIGYYFGSSGVRVRTVELAQSQEEKIFICLFI